MRTLIRDALIVSPDAELPFYGWVEVIDGVIGGVGTANAPTGADIIDGDELWIGHRDAPNQILLKDPSLLDPAARPYADLPGGHSEGYDDTFKQVFRRFYQSIDDPAAEPEYPQFADGLRQLQILEAELASHDRRAWADVPAWGTL